MNFPQRWRRRLAAITVSLLIAFVAIDYLLLTSTGGPWRTGRVTAPMIGLFVVQAGLMSIVSARWMKWIRFKWTLYTSCSRAVISVPHDPDWMKRHESINRRVKHGNIALIFIGDSIVEGWEGAGKEMWAKYYANRNAVNLGIGGDCTQHVLWRLDHGNIDGIKPQLAVLMIGTNNSGLNSAQQIASGIKAIVEKLRTKLPSTKVLILAIFPRGAGKQDAQRQINERANESIKLLADNKMTYYLDIGRQFLEPDGTLSKEVMPDLLHLNKKGYRIWAESIEPKMKELMGEI